jgi:hypothetical protein
MTSSLGKDLKVCFHPEFLNMVALEIRRHIGYYLLPINSSRSQTRTLTYSIRLRASTGVFGHGTSVFGTGRAMR